MRSFMSLLPCLLLVSGLSSHASEPARTRLTDSQILPASEAEATSLIDAGQSVSTNYFTLEPCNKDCTADHLERPVAVGCAKDGQQFQQGTIVLKPGQAVSLQSGETVVACRD